MSNETIEYTCKVCNETSTQSTYEPCWVCPKCRKAVENPNIKETHFTSEEKAEIILDQFKQELDKAICEGIGVIHFETRIIGDTTLQEEEMLEDEVRKFAAKDSRITIESLSLKAYDPRRATVILYFNLTDHGRKYQKSAQKSRTRNGEQGVRDEITKALIEQAENQPPNRISKFSALLVIIAVIIFGIAGLIDSCS